MLANGRKNSKVKVMNFFYGEMNAVKELIKQARNLLNKDSKSRAFIKDIIDKILKNNPNEKILIFTEYRATQSYLFEIMEECYGANKASLIHGGQKHYDRQKAIEQFEEKRSVSNINRSRR